MILSDRLTIESNSSYFERRDTYLYIRYKSFSVIDIDEAKLQADYAIELCDGTSMPFILDGLNTEARFTQAARTFFASYAPLLKIRKAQAFLINTVPNRMLFKFYMKFHKPKGPVKVFSNLADAEIWVKSFNTEKAESLSHQLL